MRLFVSVDLAGLADEVAAVQAPLTDASGLTLTDPAQAHVTLKFLGEQPAESVPGLTETIEQAVADAGVPPFEATFGGLGAFPSEDYIRVVWLGVEAGGEALRTLHEHVESALVDRGLEPEAHAFTPHVTLGRMHHAGGKELVQEVLEGSGPTVGSMDVTEVRLTESTRTAEGPVYETVERFPLE